MIGGMKRNGLVVLALIAVVSLATVTVSCGGSEENEATTTTVSDSTTEARGTVSTEVLVVGGSTPEEYEASLPGLEAEVEAAPENLDVLQELAIAQFQTGRYEEAAATYEKMLAIKDDAFTRNNYANVLRNWEKIDEAKAQYQQAIATDPTLAVAYVNLAVVLSQQGDNAGALDILESGLKKVAEEDKASLESLVGRLTSTTT
jgi:tetratricopeptide (TPR) repeat protein